MDVRPIKHEYCQASLFPKINQEEEKQDESTKEEAFDPPSSKSPSPLQLFNSLTKEVEPTQINSVEDFEKFMIALIQDHLDNNEQQLIHHHTHLKNIQKRKENLHKKLQDLNIKINDNGMISFLTQTQNGLTLVSVAIGLAALIPAIFSGELLIIGAVTGFLAAWNSAVAYYFKGSNDEFKAEAIPIKFSHDIADEDLKTQTKVISKSLQEWSRLASTLSRVLKNHGEVRQKAAQNIRR